MRGTWSDFLLGLAMMLLSAGYLYTASQIPDSLLSDVVGAGGVPKVLGWAMAILGAILCVRSVIVRLRQGASLTDGDNDDVPNTGARPHLLAIGLLAILVSYVLVTPYLGYPASTAFMVGAIARFCGAPLNRNLIVISLAAGLGMWLLFGQLLGIPMIMGSLWEWR